MNETELATEIEGILDSCYVDAAPEYPWLRVFQKQKAINMLVERFSQAQPSSIVNILRRIKVVI